MVKELKKATAAIMCAALAVSLCGCGKSKSAGSGAAGNGPDVGKVVMTVNGEDVTVDEYGCYIYMAASKEAYNNSNLDDNLSVIDWEAKTEDDRILSDVVKQNAMSDMLNYILIVQYGKEAGAGLTDEEKNQADEMLAQAREQGGGDYVLSSLKAMGINSEDTYKKYYELMMGFSKVEEDFAANREKYIGNGAEMHEFKSDDYVSARHILIKSDSEKYDNPLNTIKEVKQRADAGEDFNALMKEYNEDPGEPEAGYTFGHGEMVEPFEKAAFALGYDEISGIVETDYGYHIIRRDVGMAEFREYLKKNADIKINDDVMSEISVGNIVKAAYEAELKLSAQTGGNTNG